MTIYNIRRYKNYGIISPVPDGKLASELQRLMSYKRQGAEFMPNPMWAIVKLYNVKKGTFPWGFRQLVEKIMDKWEDYSNEKYKIEIYKEQITHVPYDPNRSLRPYQLIAVHSLMQNSGGILCMPTGSGKTITAIEYIKIMNLPTVIITTTLDIKKMWEEKTKYLQNVTVINYQNNMAKEYVKMSKLVIMDECHHAAAKTIYNLGMGADTDAILVGLSATPKREDGEDMRVTGALGEIVYEISRRELIDQGYLANAIVQYYSPIFDTGSDYACTYAEIYNKHIVNNFDRNTTIINLTNKFIMEGKKVLVLVSQIEHGQYLYNALCGNKIYCHGSNKERYKNLNDYNCIVASNIFNEGIDLPELDVVVLAAGGKSSIQLTQRVGRVLRPSINKDRAIVVDFIDDRPKYLKDHYAKRRAILEADFEVRVI